MIEREERYHTKYNFIALNRTSMKLGLEAISALFKTYTTHSLYISGQLTN